MPFVFVLAVVPLAPQVPGIRAERAFTNSERRAIAPFPIASTKREIPRDSTSSTTGAVDDPGFHGTGWREIGPPQRLSMLMGADPTRGRIVMVSPGPLWEARWAIDLDDPVAWRPIEDTGESRPYSLVTAIYDPTRPRWIVLGRSYRTRDLVAYSIDITETPRWSEVHVPDSLAPIALSSMNAVFDSRRSRAIVFSGYGRNAVPSRDVWTLEFEGEEPRWRRVRTGAAEPLPRMLSIAVYDSLADRVVIVGGEARNDSVFFATSEIWSL